jgi:undecaprenyl-diphosphatase
MNIIDATILGAIQGITEFIPVSSSGHLILVRDFLGMPLAGSLTFDAILQLATALAIAVYFYRDVVGVIRSLCKQDNEVGTFASAHILLWALILGTIPAALIGVMAEPYMETTFRDPMIVAAALTAGSVLMAGAEWVDTKIKALSVRRGFQIGLFQALALIPGFSRSGATIAGGLFNNVSRHQATRFAFLLGFPILFGSGVKKLWDVIQSGAVQTMGGELLVGALVSFAVGLMAIHFLLAYLKNNSLYVFVWYRLVVAGIVLVVLI